VTKWTYHVLKDLTGTAHAIWIFDITSPTKCRGFCKIYTQKLPQLLLKYSYLRSIR